MELELRDDKNYKLCVERSLANKAEIRGVFGPSLLSFMVYSPFIRSVSIDGMHCLYLGLTEQLLNLWFNTKYSSSPFSLSSKTAKVNARLKQLQLPHFVQRSPEDVTKLAFWKASLCRNFLLYLVLIILKGLMRQDFYYNLVLLVNALSILNSSSISVSDLEKADRDLINFCAGFENLYGLRHMSSNVHLLRHLSASVADTGNLFISSCFRFEDLNGKFSDLAHGTRHAVMKIASNFNILSKLPVLISNVSSDSVRLFCQKISGPSYHFEYCERISKNCFVVDSFIKVFCMTDYLPSGLNRYVMVNTHSENYDLLNVQHLKTVSFYLQVGAQHFVVDPLDNFELE
ncbi:4-hydroxy-3-methylbut-2-enyl diphosphate reductase [Frankliniella fusca]|uniref:4-hydroxy-3-methylbut-2-enyl diphosphate reductase n=1 Tax=Frankliniella fusca TaxID=407009 RepID=A0AAE1HXE5_9NEOP|nr:4-hydroxy-3-methylbut-2-enyl diphosphate reductase [Frankliniella fusca]